MAGAYWEEGMLLWLKRIVLAALALVLALVTAFGLRLALLFNGPGGGESPLYFLGWFGAATVLICGSALFALYRHRNKLW